MQAYIEPLRPVTAQLTVFAPIAAPLPLVIRVSPSTPEVRASIEAEYADLLGREAQPGGTILISHIREAISLAAGEFDHELISPLGNAVASPGSLFVPGAIAWVGA